MAGTVSPTLDQVLAFCAEEPVERVFLEDIARRGLGRFSAVAAADGRLEALCHVGANIVPSGSGCADFAAAAGQSGARMVIGEERAVGELWERARRRMPKPRDDRPGQPVYALRDAPEPGETGLRAASLGDLELLVPACAEAHREEIGIDPLKRDADGFRWRTRQQIEEGRSWLWLEDGVIRFKAEASAWTPAAVQLQQVWVDPEARRRGYGHRACATLPAAAGAGPGRLPVRPAREHAGAAPLRLDRHDPRADLSLASSSRHNRRMEELRDRVERFVREHELIPPGGEVTCLVSGGADSTCLWHLLGSLGYRVSALHVNHKLRGADSEEDARFCAEALGAEVVERDTAVA